MTRASEVIVAERSF